MSCPDESELTAFLARELTSDRARRLEDHFDACPDCRRLVYALAPAEAAGGTEAPLTIGRFVVHRAIAEGGMGIVFEAHDPTLQRDVAIKVMRVGASKLYPDARERLLREAQGLARLVHPNVVSVFDAGTHDGEVFIAMELIEGVSFDRWLADRPRGWREIVAVLERAGRGLAAAHAAGLVHRDIKPMNVMVAADGQVKVVDFGLVHTAVAAPDSPGAPDSGDGTDPGRRATDLAAARVTITGAFVGTPAYCAPEQLSGEPVDARSDVFAFCVMLYEALYGRRPFVAASVADLLALMQARRPLELPRRPAVPARLRDLLRRGLAIDPAVRPPDIGALLPSLRSAPAGRLYALGGGLAALALAAVVVTRAVVAAPAPSPCSGARAQLVGFWDGTRREAAQRAILATGVPYAAETWQRVAALLDHQADRWVAMRIEACRATAIDHSQSPALLDRRMACLDDRRAALGAAARALAELDGAHASEAIAVAAGVPSLDPCADASHLLDRPAPSADPADTSARAAIVRASALHAAGRLEEALAIARTAAATAGAVRDPETLAELHETLGVLEDEAGNPDAARTALEQAVEAAARAGDPRLESMIGSDLAIVLAGSSPDRRSAAASARRAVALAERVAGDHLLEAQARYALGRVLIGLDDAEAPREIDRAVAALDQVDGDDVPALLTRSQCEQMRAYFELDPHAAMLHLEGAAAALIRGYGPHHPYVATMREEMALALMQAGEVEAAEEAARQAAEILGPQPGSELVLRTIEAAVERDPDRAIALQTEVVALSEARNGPEAVETANHLEDLATVLVDSGRFDQAAPIIARAIRIVEAANGPEAPALVTTLLVEAKLEVGRGDLAAAARGAERAVAIASGPAADPVTRATADTSLAEVEFWQHRNASALRRLQTSLPILRAALGGDTPRTVELEFLLAATEWELGRDRPAALRRARAAYDRAVALPTRLRRDLTLLARWLDAH